MHLGEGAIMAANCDEAMPPVGALFKAQQPFTKLLVPLVRLRKLKVYMEAFSINRAPPTRGTSSDYK